MGNYLIVEHCMVIPYNNIEGRYRSYKGFMLSVYFLVIIYLKGY